ncbi:Disease resistance protein rpp13 [Thalictrum thalictroides]|uniref:Disease resistance protein rpp13 n=1 Tax=Thalictrum thalictroides TaxID=46969 RepID=A0A7J6V4P0_THATH|nr:Disease resistance protein rpp13 [Thalictrum thalictroides]
MAEIIVSPLVKRLTLIIQHEQHLLGVKDQIVSLRNQLEFIRGFVRDAEKKSRENEVVKIWVRQVRDLTYDAEDIIDDFNFHLGQQQKNETITQRIVGFWKRLKTVHRIGKLVEQFNRRSKEISTYRSRYNIDVAVPAKFTGYQIESLASRRRTTHIVEETIIVGFHKEAADLAGWLVNETAEPRRSIMSIVGMGGLGKTTLAKLIYGKREVEKHFKVRAWIYASQEYRVRDLLLSTLKQSIRNISIEELSRFEKMDDGELKIELHEVLKGKRYFVVIDDIWKIEAWGRIKGAFPENQNGSRLLFTTRNKDVAIGADLLSHHHDLRLLSTDESWELFCSKVFSVSEAKDARFFDILRNNNYSGSAAPRRLAIHSSDTTGDANDASISFQKLHSLLFFDDRFLVDTWKSTFGERIRMLRVLDLDGVNLYKGIPLEVYKLVFLQYLGLTNTSTVRLPPSIGELVNLQTLDASSTYISKIAKELWKCTQLRHLYLDYYGRAVPDSLEDLPKNLLLLETSGVLYVLCWLGFVKLSLRTLTLHGELEGWRELPPHCFPSSLTELVLESSALREDPSSVLESLPMLKELRLRYGSYIGKNMVFSAKGFELLEFLELVDMLLVDWTVEDGAMPNLRHLVISECPGLKMLPDGLVNVTTLQRIEISKMSKEFSKRVKEDGEDWSKIRHVPFIICK